MKSANNSFAFDQIISVQNGSFRGKEEKSIISIKKTRKLIENDAQILANRIALLRNEELKSWKRIEEAKKKAKEVYQIKVQAEEKLYRRENSRNKDDSLLMKRLQTPTSEIKKQGQLKRESIRQALQDQKHTEMLQIRQQRELNEKKKRVFQNKMLENNRSKSQSVREQKNLSELRKNDYYVNKINQYRQMRETEVSFQENLKNQKVMEVLALGKMEVELVKKLQHTQEVEKSTVEQLEEAIHLPITEYKSKYQIKEVKRDSRKRISTPVIRLNQERSLQEIKKTDLNESVTSDRRSQSVLKDTPSLTRENRSHQSLERTERIKRIYGRPTLEKGRSTGRESSDHSVNRSMEGRDSARKGLKSRTKSRGGERNSTPGNLEEPKKTLSSSNQNRSLLIDVGR